MNKFSLLLAAFFIALVFAHSADATLLRPNVVLSTPQTGDILKGDISLVADITFPENSQGDKVEAKSVIFEYRNNFCAGSGTCVRGQIANDKDGTDGWSTIWDTTTVPDGEYYLTIYVFGGDGYLLVNWYKSGFMQVNQSGVSKITGSVTTPVETPIETNHTQPETPKEEPKNVTVTPIEQPAAEPAEPAPKKRGFWGAFFQWLKDLFS